MKILELLLNELAFEARTTRKMLALVPEGQFEWAPHQKSMNLKTLAAHVAELPSWITLGLETDQLDFATEPYTPEPVTSTADILAYFEKCLASGQKSLETANEEDLAKKWILRDGDQILADLTKYEAIRNSFSQTIHHRAQLGVYLRLLNIPIPGSYGPSADDQGF